MFFLDRFDFFGKRGSYINIHRFCEHERNDNDVGEFALQIARFSVQFILSLVADRRENLIAELAIFLAELDSAHVTYGY